jgi:DNA-binding SARP family transcriptional activator
VRVLARRGPVRVSPPPQRPFAVRLSRAQPACGRLARLRGAFSLWPEETEERARELLRRNLYVLAQSLPGARLAPWILSENDSLRWNPAAEWELDVDRFEACFAAGDPASLARAVAVYRGDLCEGLYDEWVLGQRERFRSRYVEALERLARVHRGRGEPSLALGYVKRVLHAEPWREDVVRRAIRLRLELGDRGGAIAEFEAFARRLRDDFGAEPMPETLALRDAASREGSLATAPSGSDREALERARSLGALPFVGREREMHALGDAWTRARCGAGSVALVVGESGIGKSRLLAEFALAVEAEGGCVLSGGCASPERRPFAGLASALADSWRLFADLPLPGEMLSVLAAFVLGFRRGEAHRLGAEHALREQAHLFDALACGIAALARARPAVLVLDDAQSAGDGTLAALAAIAARAAAVPLLVVAAFRSDARGAASRWRDDLSGSVPLETISPARLSPCAVARALADDATGSEAVRALTVACDGNPGALTDLVREMRANGLDALLPTLERSVDERFGARLARCSSDGRTFVETAALVGLEFESEIVARALGWDEGRAYRALDECLDLRLIEDASRGRLVHRFAHAPLQGRLALALSREVRRGRHRRLAAVFESLDCGDDDRSREIARHAERGGDLARAGGAYEVAAQRAEAVFAFDDARALRARALLCAQGDVSARAASVSGAKMFARDATTERPLLSTIAE